MIMCKHILACLVFLALTAGPAFPDVLIVADEFPAMQSLAAKLGREEHVKSTVIAQTNLPAGLARFEAVVVYIHQGLSEKTEDALIDYARAGGKLVVLHHSISSGKRKNARWLPFLGVALPEGDAAQGGYKWIEGVTWQLVNLNSNHFIMTNKVQYPARVAYGTNLPPDASGLPGFTLENSEVYLNHVHTEPRTLLMGLRYIDSKSGTTYCQDRAGWVKPAGKGLVIYLMPGHVSGDFENVAYGRIVLNAIVYKP